jgi:signal transduction histidine kinase
VPTRFRWYVVTVSAAGLVLLAYQASRFIADPDVPNPASFAILSVLALIGHAFPVEIRDAREEGRRQIQLHSVSAVWSVALLVEWGAAAATTSVVVAALVADGVRRVIWWRACLNASMLALCIGAGRSAYNLVGQGAEMPSIHWMLAVVAAGMTSEVVNHVLFKSGRGLYTGERIGKTIREDFTLMLNSAIQMPLLAVGVVVIADVSAILTITTIIPGLALVLALREQVRRRQAAEEAARNARQLAQQEAALARRQKELLTQLSHAVRTPLTIVLGVCDTLRRRYGDLPIGTQQDMVQQAVRAARHLNGLVDNVLRTAGYDVQPSPVTPHAETVDLAAVAGEVVAQERAHVQNLRIQFETCDKPLTVLGDHDGLAMILRNLVDNAVQSILPEGRIMVTAALAGEAPVAVVAVEDDGPGIPPGDRRRIFSPFIRLGGYDSGIGLGLHVAAAEARLHGGTVVHTDPSVLSGAHAELRLPLAGVSAPAGVLDAPWALVSSPERGEHLRPPQQIG